MGRGSRWLDLRKRQRIYVEPLSQLQISGNPHRQERPHHPASCPHEFTTGRSPSAHPGNRKPASILHNLISHWICNILLEELLVLVSAGSGYCVSKLIGKIHLKVNEIRKENMKEACDLTFRSWKRIGADRVDVTA